MKKPVLYIALLAATTVALVQCDVIRLAPLPVVPLVKPAAGVPCHLSLYFADPTTGTRLAEPLRLKVGRPVRFRTCVVNDCTGEDSCHRGGEL